VFFVAIVEQLVAKLVAKKGGEAKKKLKREAGGAFSHHLFILPFIFL
jgi:hypothetical protein